mmetsp:Transcript_15639/g.42133  ORF Transcript_15639/g.42133 Transcript_15639/m.42133 type:complete len:329 (-) Transcript_15639:1278-2264(-)
MSSGETVDVQFEFFDAEAYDEPALKRLLMRRASAVCSVAVDVDAAAGAVARALCIKGASVGSVVKSTSLEIAAQDAPDPNGAEDDALGVAAVLSFPAHARALKPFRQRVLHASAQSTDVDLRSERIRKALRSASSAEVTLSSLLHRMTSEAATSADDSGPDRDRVALLLLERVINLPPQLVPDLLRTLEQELQEKQQQERCEDDEERKLRKRTGEPDAQLAAVTYLLYFTEAYEVSAKAKEGKGEMRELLYPKPEDEALVEHADATISWHSHLTSKISDGSVEYAVRHIAMLVSVDKLRAAATRIERVLLTQGAFRAPFFDTDQPVDR